MIYLMGGVFLCIFNWIVLERYVFVLLFCYLEIGFDNRQV